MTTLAQSTDTVAALLTPVGIGAIATIAVHGPVAWETMRQLFRPHSRTGACLPECIEAGRVWVGRIGKDTADEVVLALKQTGPISHVEVHSHGGREVVRMLFELLRQEGINQCTWEAFERRTETSLLRALAGSTLARAPTVRTASILLDQYHGAFSRAIEAIHAGAPVEAGRLLRELKHSVPIGRHLTESWRVVVAGPPNVGKSSLVNALAGFQRCVVSPQPGTTRDVVTTVLALDGWPVELADTAGQHATDETLEQAGIALAHDAVARADLVLWLLDASTEPIWPVEQHRPILIVINKIDLPASWDLTIAEGAVQVSAQTGAGLATVCEAIAHRLVPSPPVTGTAIPFTAELCDVVEAAWDRWQAGDQAEAVQLLSTRQ